MTSLTPFGLAVGEQLGHLEYVIDEAALGVYQQLVGETGQYPNLLAEDCLSLLRKRAGSAALTTVWQRFQFLRPPVLGRRIQVAGWLREISHRDGSPWLRVASFAVDEIGAEILRSEAAFLVGADPPTDVCANDVARLERAYPTGSLANALVGDCLSLGLLTLPPAREVGGRLTATTEGPGAGGTLNWHVSLASMVGSWLESRLGSDFGDDFRWGGELSIALRPAAHPGERLAADGVVISRDADAGGVVVERVMLSIRNELNRQVANAEAVVMMPSPRLL